MKILFTAALLFAPMFLPQPTLAQPIARGLVAINRPQVELRDLFSGLGQQGNLVLGPAPAPGQRIFVGTAQLTAIAEEYGIGWQSHGVDMQVIIERPGRPLSRATITAAIATALQDAGAPAHCAITLPDFTPPMVPPDASPRIMINRLAFDSLTHSFTAELLIGAPGMAPQSASLSGLAQPTTHALVATHDLVPGEILGSSDVAMAWVADAGTGVMSDPSQAYGLQIHQAVAANSPLTMDQLGAPTLIAKGDQVTLDVMLPGLDVSAQGVSLSQGGKGDLISVLNPASHEIVQAMITGPDTAQVNPASTPMRARQIGYGAYAMNAASYDNQGILP